MPSFNLLHEHWLPVLDRTGHARFTGIREALLRAHEIERIGPVPPLAEAALHRLLLAVLHRALGGPADLDGVITLYKARRLPVDRLEAYFTHWSHRFDLFDAAAPFYQVPDLPNTNNLRDPWARLAAERASGYNPTLFDHSVDDDPRPITPAEAAMALVVHQSFTPGGLIKKLGVTSGKAAPLAGKAVFLPQGGTLFDTLLLNLAPPYHPDDDLPIWERDPYRTCDITNGRACEMLSGRTRVYTWMARAVRLLPEPDGTVRFIAYGPGVSPLDSPELDPMWACQRTSNTTVPYHLRADRAFWRDFEAILPGHADWIPPRTVEHARELRRATDQLSLLFPLTVIGQDTDQAKVVDVRRETYPLSARALDPQEAAVIREALGEAEDTHTTLAKAAKFTAKTLKPYDVGNLVNSFPLYRLYWSRLEAEFPGFLTTLAHDGLDTARRAWCRTVRKAARAAWDTTANSIGSAARHLKAIAEGERVVSRLFKKAGCDHG